MNWYAQKRLVHDLWYLLHYQHSDRRSRYVGKSKNIERRIKDHGVSQQKNLVYKVLQVCAEPDLDEAEWNWITELRPELNRTVPVLHPTKGKIWRSPNVSKATLKRRRKGVRGSYKISYDLLAGLKAVAKLEDRSDTAQLERWIRESIELWRSANPTQLDQLEALTAAFLAELEGESDS